MTRSEFLQTMSGAAAAGLASGLANAQSAKANIRRGVTFYSYQEEYYTRTMTVEDCFAELRSMSAEGVELIAEAMVPNYPDPPEAWVDRWRGLIDKYQVKPVCMDTFVDTTWGGHRKMSLQESVDMLVTQMKLATRLGFHIIRPTTGPVAEGAPDMILGALPFAERLDVKIAVEIHSPITLRSRYISDYVELIHKTGTKHFGFTADMGIFAKRTPRVAVAHFLRRGGTPAIIEHIQKRFLENLGAEKTRAEVEKMGGNDVDNEFAFHAYAFGPVENDPADLRPIMPYVYNIHGKFYEMMEDLREYSIPYDRIIPVLLDAGYNGYINSEYEGQRLTQDAFETDSCEQVRRHHVMLRRLLGEV